MADMSIKNIDPKVKLEFDILTKKNGTSMSAVLKECMVAYVKKHKTPHVP